ncbi:MAG: hypothetical protein HPY74_05900 [Firmicutes bacterium]|nr:hypothetical protein [Bacillota bacterium]
MYQKTDWVDIIRDSQGNVIQEGTVVAANVMNNSEKGIFEAFILNDVLMQEMQQRKRELENNIPEIGQIVLTNAQQYPFNNSKVTVNLVKARNTLNYTVTVEYNGNNVGDVIVSDKQLNGFKLEYTGSAASVTVKYYVRGGIY